MTLSIYLSLCLLISPRNGGCYLFRMFAVAEPRSHDTEKRKKYKYSSMANAFHSRLSLVLRLLPLLPLLLIILRLNYRASYECIHFFVVFCCDVNVRVLYEGMCVCIRMCVHCLSIEACSCWLHYDYALFRFTSFIHFLFFLQFCTSLSLSVCGAHQKMHFYSVFRLFLIEISCIYTQRILHTPHLHSHFQ